MGAPLALPFNPAVPRRLRAGWTLLVAAMVLSMRWAPAAVLFLAESPAAANWKATLVTARCAA